MLDKNRGLDMIQLAGCSNAVDDTSMALIAKQAQLEFLDLSYCKQITDHGLYHFFEKELPITSLAFNGMTGITSIGLGNFLTCCTKTLVDIELANLDQEGFKSDCFAYIGKCWNLELLDVAGCKNLDD